VVRVIGIDPGTVSFDLCGLEDGEVFLDLSIPSADVADAPRALIEVLEAARPLDLVIGPSGYGLPWVPVGNFSPQDRFLSILTDERDHGRAAGVGGMGRVLASLQACGLPVLLMPGVIHLPTVPEHRKANKIDMGTADKLCCLALGVFDQARRLGIAYEETAFIYVEVGGAYTAVMAVQDGQVVDGLGGSSGPPGFYAMGGMDGELAYLLGEFHKDVLFSGGVVYIAGKPTLSPEEAARRMADDPAVRRGWEALFEGVVKCVAAEITVVPEAREILLSGRLTRLPAIQDELVRRLSPFAPVRRVSGIAATAKEAAQGAALIADGMAGGRFARLVDVMRLREARGTVLDHIYVSTAGALREKYRAE